MMLLLIIFLAADLVSAVILYSLCLMSKDASQPENPEPRQ